MHVNVYTVNYTWSTCVGHNTPEMGGKGTEVEQDGKDIKQLLNHLGFTLSFSNRIINIRNKVNISQDYNITEAQNLA